MTIVAIVLIIAALVFAIMYRKYLSRFTLHFHPIFHQLELPIVTLKSGGKEFNFLVDTGSNRSHLKLGVAEQMDSQKMNVLCNGEITTGNGAVQHYGYYKVNFNLGKNADITQEFELMDLEDTFANWGINIPIHGILGVDFIRGNGYKLDFNLLLMYE